MATEYNRSKIVTDNLVLYLDAGNTKSYTSSSPTTWNDISGNGNNATLVHSPTHTSGVDGYFTFDGANDYAKIDDSSDFLFGTGSFTEEAWHKRDGNTGWENPISRYDPGSWGGLWMSNEKFYPYHYGESSNVTFDANMSVGTDWVHHVAVTFNSGSAVTIRVYKNSALQAVQSTTVSGWQPKGTSVGDSDVYIGGNMGSYWYDGKIALCRIYKGKGLTAAEVKQNFDAQKSRFGL